MRVNKVMAYLGVTIGGLIPITVFSLLFYCFVFRKMNRESRCFFAVTFGYVLASMIYAYNSLPWGIGFGLGFIDGLLNYALAGVLCYMGYFLYMKAENKKAKSRI